MDNLEKFLAFVKSQDEFHTRQSIRFKHDLRRFDLHSGTAKTFNELHEFLSNIEEHTALISSMTKKNPLSLGWNELEDLPPELMAELSITDSDKLDYSIAELIEKSGGVASLDRILVDIYKLTGEILKRTTLNARLYRMMQKGLVYSVPTKKGVYSSTPITEEDAVKVT